MVYKKLPTSECVCLVVELRAGGGTGVGLQAAVVVVQADGLFAVNRALSEQIAINT